ncbi:MAG TPA: histidinol dehydrogenase, partial [Halomonas sp.]|nr:histidinol dehydrogenase [Halomonas sp.]
MATPMKTPMKIARLSTADSDFDARLDALLAWEGVSSAEVAQRVDAIIAAVRDRGDDALVEYSNRFDRLAATGMAELILSPERLKRAFDSLPGEQREALTVAAERVRTYHEHQKAGSWRYTDADGSVLGQQITPLDRAGVYVPGGKAAYPSSVLMNAIPARVAGVSEIIMVVPTPDGVLNELVLAAAHLAGVDKV